MRGALGALLEFLHRFAEPTGTRGSVLLMTGGLIVLGFLFLAFIFRSAIVGDLAPVANARAPVPHAELPAARAGARTSASVLPFDEARARAAAEREPWLDLALDRLQTEGLDAKVLRSTAESKVVRAYACLSCEREARGTPFGGCEHERGLLAGAFEALTGDLAKVEEIACRAGGAPHCEFHVRHAPLPEAPL